MTIAQNSIYGVTMFKVELNSPVLLLAKALCYKPEGRGFEIR
jgi:hypothetical protein